MLNKLGLLLTISATWLLNKTGVAIPQILTSQKLDLAQNKDSLISLLQKNIVSNQNYYQHTLYTWTTSEQVEEIKKNDVVLIKSKGENDVSFMKNPYALKR